MAFDQNTRNRLQRFVAEARALLTEEFSRYMQNDYGMDPISGTISPLDHLRHLDDARRETARLLRDTFDHYKAQSPTSNNSEILDRILREQAFTVLNRLCAIRMAEAREIVIESIGSGYNSKGFQLYHRLVGHALGEIGEAYRCYLFSLFDEFAVDLPVLFDRYSSMGRLFPKPEKLISGNSDNPGLIEMMNHHDLVELWTADETIGWIYQYFNSVEERKQMRAESQAPRNSRELAVRNQFFTPRYVVEFLTDNTLGRLWYEMTQGNTILVDKCTYMVRRPKELFLKQGEETPQPLEDIEQLSQEEILKQPAFIPFRALKDPREIRMLDPACGSMHFGLYAFDLFEIIYSEAWDIEEQQGIAQIQRCNGLKPLCETYATKEDFLKDIPKLIIENNIHGVDIDPRATQIAGLSLWLRAQRSWKEQNLKAALRPQIMKSNVVCAEPMPGEEDMLKEFTKSLQPRVLGQLVEIIFEKMKLAGEAGSLLRIEEEIQEAVDTAREEFNRELLCRNRGEQLALFEGMNKPHQLNVFDFADLADKTEFWDTVEHQVIDSLKKYAEHVENGNIKKSLFAHDAVKGFAFIGIFKKKYEVILMNPPFGEYPISYRDKAANQFTSGSHDIIAGFIERVIKCNNNGYIGCISSRAIFFGPTNAKWREKVVIPEGVVVWSELGQSVLDGAMVETCMYVLGNSYSKTSIFLRPQNGNYNYQDLLLEKSSVFPIDVSNFSMLKGSPFAYWLNNRFFWCFKNLPSLEDSNIKVRVGLQTGDDFRFIRIWCEVPSESLLYRKWIAHAKGGDNSPYYTDIHLVTNWEFDGKEVSAQPSVRLNMYSGSNPDLYMKSGMTFAYRTNRFSPGIMPNSTIAGVAGMGIFVETKDDIFEILSVLNSSIVNAFIEARLGQLESQSLYQAGTISPTPWADFKNNDKKKLHDYGREAYEILRYCLSENEISRYFLPPDNFIEGVKSSIEKSLDKRKQAVKRISEIYDSIDQIVSVAYGFKDELKEHVLKYGKYKFKGAIENILLNDCFQCSDFLSYLVGIIFGRWDIRIILNSLSSRELPNPTEELPICSPAMLKSDNSLFKQANILNDYPVEIIWDGILVCDEEQSRDIVKSLHKLIELIWGERAVDIEYEACELLGIKSLRDYFGNTNKFFADHLKRYSRSRRQAPIYWPLTTFSGNYTIWLYYHRLTSQTLYTCVNDFVEPKLKLILESINNLQRKTARTKQEEKELESLIEFDYELKDFRNELLHIAKFWKPNLDDGVQITAAPLWKLFQYKPWQKTLKETWQALEKGEYDWSHMAYSIWPERVIRKAHNDRSIAIAHNLEENLWEEIPDGKDRDGNPKTKWVPKKLSEEQLKKIIKEKTSVQ